MKTFEIALKDLKHIFQSVFSLVMMFGAPLLITGLLYFAFGGLASGRDGFNLPVTRVQIVNLDQPGTDSSTFAAGQMLVNFLQDPSLSEVIEVSLAPGEASGRDAVDDRRAGVAVIIPSNFTDAASSPDRTAEVIIYHDPTLTIGPGIVKDLVSHFMDGFSGAEIAGQVALETMEESGTQPDSSLHYQVAQEYSAWLQSNGHSEGEGNSRLTIATPIGTSQTSSQGAALIGPIMAGMLVFFVFFMGANGAESIIREDEQGTLARIFSTPTNLSAIFAGKFLGIVVSLCIQVVLLLFASTILFGIQWGQWASITLVSIGLIVASAGFGVMLMSFIKNSRQTGPVLGGVMTLTGMLGGLFSTAMPNLPASFEKVTLVTPQGWALKAWKLALAGVGGSQTIEPVIVLLIMGLLFFGVGVVLFRRRFS